MNLNIYIQTFQWKIQLISLMLFCYNIMLLNFLLTVFQFSISLYYILSDVQNKNNRDKKREKRRTRSAFKAKLIKLTTNH